jgi:hypothetical protein
MTDPSGSFHQKLVVLLIGAQFALIGLVGLLAILAPATLLFRVATWTGVLFGLFAASGCLFAYWRARSGVWLLAAGLSALALIAVVPLELWAMLR